MNGKRSLIPCLKAVVYFNFVIFLHRTKNMDKKLKYILIIAFVIVVIVVIYSLTTSEPSEDALKNEVKKQEIDGTYSVWLNVAGSGDKQTLTQNEASIKQDLYDKLDLPEVTSLKQYSIAIQDFLSVKNKPLNPLFITSLSYLTTNFNAVKQIIGKTNAGSVLSNFMLAPGVNKSMSTESKV